MPAIYAQLDVLVVPSLWPENSPLVIHEAFMHGVAVVGARVGGIPGLVEDGVSGFTYEAFSPDALGAVLQRFLDDPGLADRLASRAPGVKTITQDAAEWEVGTGRSSAFTPLLADECPDRCRSRYPDPQRRPGPRRTARRDCRTGRLVSTSHGRHRFRIDGWTLGRVPPPERASRA